VGKGEQQDAVHTPTGVKESNKMQFIHQLWVKDSNEILEREMRFR
jgi:hypothetical protein